MTQEWLAQNERSNTFAIRSIVWVALSLGRRAGLLLLYPICWYFLIFSLKARTASRVYLRRVLAREPAWSEVFRHYHAFATTILDRVFLLNRRYDLFDIRVYGEEVLWESLARGRGGFLLGAHLGSFEVLHAFGRERAGLRVNMVMFQEHSRKLNSVARAINPDFAADIIGLGRFDSMLKVSESLERGEFVGFLGDRMLTSGGGLSCDFLGAPAPFPAAPYRIAAMLKRPIILMCALYRGGNRYDLYFEHLIDAPELSRGERDAKMREWLARYVERLEHYCREAPYNWFNFYDFWREG
jgi:predicted LPLAT superfamily acyltransferase